MPHPSCLPGSLFKRRIRLCLAGAILSFTGAWSASLQAKDFKVAVYNLENLFDGDGVAAYDDYQPQVYKAAHLRTKVQNAADLVSKLSGDGRGPDIIFFQEVEVDQTPDKEGRDARALVSAVKGTPLTSLLPASLEGEVAAACASWPAEAWLLKAMEDRGMTGYTVVTGTDGRMPDGRTAAIKNVIFTRFPVREVINHPIPGARNILEVLVDVEGIPLRLFANHWKSGASDVKTEPVRVADARVLRQRLDEVLATDPHADVLIGGDFNSQYNQTKRYPEMKQTGVNDILRSQGSESALLKGSADLYNLWYELKPSARGSDTYRGEWGTLMQLILTRGLYDYSGVQYVDGSFVVARIAGYNDLPDGTPRRWNSGVAPAGAGFSDHYPILASFTTIAPASAQQDRWLELKNPSDGTTPSEPNRINVSITALSGKALDLASLAEGVNLRDGTYTGKLCKVEAIVTGTKKLSVSWRKVQYDVYCPEPRLREYLSSRWRGGETVRFYGELGQYKGRWQFVIRDKTWLAASR